MAVSRYDKSDEFAFIPDQFRRKGLGKEPHAYSSDMAKFSTTLTLRRNGQITLPSEVRRRMRASEGDVFVTEYALPTRSFSARRALSTHRRRISGRMNRGKVSAKRRRISGVDA
jgi:bifunctional DNA-binding transcriptional regulator/antitoxin component of YhaV-PrlF toxin-antitoxin module